MLKKYRFLLISLILLVVLGFVVNKGDMVLWLNQFHQPILNKTFVFVTNVGDALTIFVFLILVVLKYDYRKLMFFIMAFVLESLVIIVSKKIIFHGTPRPYLFFEQMEQLHLLDFVEGLKINKRNSFPSGHTAYAFFIATYFTILVPQKWLKFLLISLAALVGISRVYLVQHFFVDVCVGASVGIFMTLVAYEWTKKWQKSWLDKKIINIKRYNNYEE